MTSVLVASSRGMHTCARWHGWSMYIALAHKEQWAWCIKWYTVICWGSKVTAATVTPAAHFFCLLLLRCTFSFFFFFFLSQERSSRAHTIHWPTGNIFCTPEVSGWVNDNQVTCSSEQLECSCQSVNIVLSVLTLYIAYAVTVTSLPKFRQPFLQHFWRVHYYLGDLAVTFQYFGHQTFLDESFLSQHFQQALPVFSACQKRLHALGVPVCT